MTSVVCDYELIQRALKKLGGEDLTTHYKAIEELANFGEKAVPYLVARIYSDNSILRLGAFQALAKMGERAESAVPALIKAAKCRNADIRWSAVETLGWIGGARAVTALTKASRDDDDAVKMMAAKSLGKIGTGAQAALPVLIEMLKKEGEYIRNEVNDALANMGEPALRALLAAVKQGVLTREQAEPAMQAIRERMTQLSCGVKNLPVERTGSKRVLRRAA